MRWIFFSGAGTKYEDTINGLYTLYVIKDEAYMQRNYCIVPTNSFLKLNQQKDTRSRLD